jgi:hypothetical protein
MDKADFSNVGFKAAYFYKVVFRDSTSFSGSQFGQTNFINARFFEIASFVNSSFLGNISFRKTEFENDAHFYRASFNSKVDLMDCSYGRLFLHWDTIKDQIDFAKNKNSEDLYQRLADNYKNLGWGEDYGDCFHDMLHWKKELTPVWFSYMPQWIPWIGAIQLPNLNRLSDEIREWVSDYGTKPFQPILRIGFIVLLAILVFGFFYWIIGDIRQDDGSELVTMTATRLSEDTYRIEYVQPKSKNHGFFLGSLGLSIYFSFLTFASRDTRRFKANKCVNWWIALERHMGPILLSIFMLYYLNLLGRVQSYFIP